MRAVAQHWVSSYVKWGLYNTNNIRNSISFDLKYGLKEKLHKSIKLEDMKNNRQEIPNPESTDVTLNIQYTVE